MNVHIDMDQSVQSEPRLRLLLAENLLRDANELITRMEVNRNVAQQKKTIKARSF
jgi:hypothetical protein